MSNNNVHHEKVIMFANNIDGSYSFQKVNK
jgi:hypothetical protein